MLRLVPLFLGGGGDDTQRLNQSPVVFAGQTFSAPVELRHEFDFRYADVAWRWRKFFGIGGFGIETLAGVGYADLDLSIASPTQRASENVSGASRVEAYIVQALGPNAAVRAGYAAWSIISERENASDIHVRFSGPALGLDLLF